MSTASGTLLSREQALDDLGLGIFEIDVASGRVTWNGTLQALAHLTAPPLTGDWAALFAAVHPDDAQRVIDALERLRAGTDKTAEELRVIAGSGECVWLDCRSRVLRRGPDGAPLHILGTVTDITARRLGELQLALNRALAPVLADVEEIDVLLQEALIVGAKVFGVADGVVYSRGADGLVALDTIGSAPSGPAWVAAFAALDRSAGGPAEGAPAPIPELAGVPRGWIAIPVRSEGVVEAVFVFFPRGLACPSAGLLGMLDTIAAEIGRAVARIRARAAAGALNAARVWSDAMLRATFEATDEGILVAGQGGVVYAANRRFLEIWRIPAALHDRPEAELLAHAVGEVADPNAFLAGVQVVYGTHDPSGPDTVLLKDGRVLERSSVSIAFDGRWARLWSFRDVTQERSSAAELRASQAALESTLVFLREAQGIARLGGWKAFPASNRVYWTEEVFRLADHPLDEPPATLEEGLRYYTPASLQRVLPAIDHTIATGEPFQMECELVSRTGRAFWAELRCVGRTMDPVEGLCLVGTIQDITERRRTEERITASEERYRILADYSPDWQYWISPAGEYLYVSPGVETIAGVSPEEMIAAPGRMLELVHPDDRAAWVAHWREVVGRDQHDHQDRLELRIVRPDGTVRWIEHQCRSTFSHDGTYRGRRGVNRDITQSKLAQLELERHRRHLQELVAERTSELRTARDAAEAASRTKSAFLANMSHEMRNPLNAILGLTHLLQADASAPQLDRLEKVHASARHLLGLINDILDLAKIEAGKMDVLDTDFEVEEVLASSLRLLGDAAQAKGLALHLRIDPTIPPRLRGDAGRIGQIALNFVSNAVKFTRRGHVTLSALPGWDSRVRILVEDTGSGIEPEVLSRLFQPFEQGDITHTRVHGGTGLGLAISRGLAELLGGTVGVESTPGQGSRFWCDLPLAAAQVSVAPKRPLANRRALVAGRAGEPTDIVREILVSLGAQVLVADRLDPDTLAAYEPFSLAVIDREHPHLDALLARLQAWPAAPDVLLTGPPPSPAPRAEVLADLSWPLTRAEMLSVLSVPEKRRPDQERSRMAEAFAALRGTRVLLAEDNLINQELAVALLNTVGLDVERAADGVEAVEKASKESFALVLMDVQMPRMDGLAATRAIRRLPGLEALPILAMTAAAFEEDRQMCLDAGMNDRVTKPVDPEQLYNQLLRWLPRPITA